MKGAKSVMSVVTLARNEEKYLPALAETILAQTRKPDVWCIVDDGSTDKTPLFIKSLEKQYNWIKSLRRTDRGFYSRGKGSLEAMQEGIEYVWSLNNPDIIGVCDADITFGKDALSRVEKNFIKNENLGIYGGEITEFKNKQWVTPAILPTEFVRGAFKFYRKKCFKEIGGIKIIKGWSAIDNMYALMLGWEVVRDITLHVRHHRPKGKRDGLNDHQKAARNAYYMNSDTLLVSMRGLRRMIKERPFIVGGLVFLSTFFTNKLLKKEQFPDKDLLKFIQRHHKKILKKGYYRW
jgi:glycosyltransferase involved in cell wall biosynthesis